MLSATGRVDLLADFRMVPTADLTSLAALLSHSQFRPSLARTIARWSSIWSVPRDAASRRLGVMRFRSL